MSSDPPIDRRAGSQVLWLAVASLVAAGIHFAVIGDHFDEFFAFGLFFAVTAWAQALWAVAIVISADRRLIVAGLAGNLSVIVVWVASRTTGLPIGPEPWTAEAVGAADLLATALEAAIVAGCVVILARGERPAARPRQWGPALALGVALAVVATAAIAADGEHGHVDDEASGHHSSTDSAAGDESHDHLTAGGLGEPDLAQIDLIRHAMRKYREVRVAEAEGWHKEHADYPGLGAHFYRAGDWAGSQPARPELDVTDPEFLMYSRFLTGDWKLVAVAYVLDQARYPEPPNTLVGATYHEHQWNCIKGGEELEEEDWGVISKEECDIMGGRWSPGAVWMTHVWLVDNPNGIFAETNPTLDPLNTT